jgi:KipI family sensor histidine kinase inhibitor
MNCVPYGPKALLFRFAEKVGDEAFAKGCGIAAELERNPPAGMIEFVPAFTTVLVKFEEAEQALAAQERLPRNFEKCESVALPPRPVVEIPVFYDGIDLERVAELHALTPGEVIEIHSASIYKVYMLGFSPGFPYLGDLDSRLHTPRLPSPRTRVAAGSVAIGGEHTGIYPVESPGGWNIIGRTKVKLFDHVKQGAEMFLLRHGDRVRFVPTSE